MSYTLQKDGDIFEQHYWNAFLEADFPNYEKYWAKHIVPLTKRPDNVHFKPSQQLRGEGYTADDICKAQLHYTTFRHLVRTFEILNTLKSKDPQAIIDTDILAEGLFHIAAAQDVAFEFLQRGATPNQFDPWAPKKSESVTNQAASQEASKKWKIDNDFPLQDIRDYRNHLTHGRMSPSIQSLHKVLLPKIGKEIDYLDWRLVTDWDSETATITDFDSLDSILADAWDRTLKYLNEEWGKIVCASWRIVYKKFIPIYIPVKEFTF
jgi:hypothetical protein